MNIFHIFIFLARSFHSFINSSETDSATRRQFSKFLSCFQSSWSFVNCNRLLGKINPQKLWERKFYHNFRIQSFHPPLPRKAEIENLRYWDLSTMSWAAEALGLSSINRHLATSEMKWCLISKTNKTKKRSSFLR